MSDDVKNETEVKAEMDPKRIEADVVGVLKTVYDPEIPIDIYELGLIYEINVNDDLHVDIKMTLTAPGCVSLPVWSDRRRPGRLCGWN